jgi:ferredoxin
MDAVQRAFAARGAGQRVRTEAFVLGLPNAGDAARGRLRFARARREVQGDGRTLLEQVEASGLDGRRGCGMGICMSCRCKKLSGVTRDLRTGRLSTEDNEDIQLCTSVAVSDVALDL